MGMMSGSELCLIYPQRFRILTHVLFVLERAISKSNTAFNIFRSLKGSKLIMERLYSDLFTFMTPDQVRSTIYSLERNESPKLEKQPIALASTSQRRSSGNSTN